MRAFLHKHSGKIGAAALLAMMGISQASASTAPAGGSGVIIDLGPGTNSGTPFNFISFANNTVGTIISILLFLAGAAAVIYLIWAGIKYLTAGGDTKKAEDARKAIVNAVIGLIIVVSTYFIVRIAFGAGQSIQGLESNSLDFQNPR